MYSLSLWCTVGCRILLGLTIYFMIETIALKSIFRQGTLTIFPYIADLSSRNIINIMNITSCIDTTCCHQPSYKSKLNTHSHLQLFTKMASEWHLLSMVVPYRCIGRRNQGCKKVHNDCILQWPSTCCCELG